MQQEYTNVIYRLHELIVNLKESSANYATDVFADVFNIDREDNVKIFLFYSHLFILCNESLKVIDKDYPNKPSLKTHIENTMDALSKIDFNKYNGMSDFNSTLKIDTLSVLKVIADMTPCTEKILPDDKLSEISKDINAMIDRILKSNMNEDLKYILTNRLLDIIMIIKNY